jgi:hypothetical protein
MSYDNLSTVSQNVLKFYQQLTGEERRIPFILCFLSSFGSFGQAVSEEKILKNRPIRNKNCLWWPCLSMDREKKEQSL